MEQVYQHNIETSMSNALPDIAYYMLAGLVCGVVLEAVMPAFDEEKDSVALFLEIFAQITLVVFAFMLINSKCGGRNGIIVFILILVGCQPSLFQKINALQRNVFGPKDESKQTSEIEATEALGATSIEKLPKENNTASHTIQS